MENSEEEIEVEEQEEIEEEIEEEVEDSKEGENKNFQKNTDNISKIDRLTNDINNVKINNEAKTEELLQSEVFLEFKSSMINYINNFHCQLYYSYK